MGFIASADFANGVPRRWDAALFGEAASRIVVTVDPDSVPDAMEAASAAQVPALTLGRTGGRRLQLGNLMDLPVEELAGAWYGGLSNAIH